MISRRRFLATGIAGAAALAFAYRLRAAPPASDASRAAVAGLDADAATLLGAIIPVMLDGALPAAAAEREDAIADTLRGIATAIAGLAPSARHELAQLFSLLAFAPARIVLAGVRTPWSEASPAAIGAFLERWRTSSFLLQRSAYDALHQLTFAAWYGNARAWPAIGYPGPPATGR